jgi:hypothetical protein
MTNTTDMALWRLRTEELRTAPDGFGYQTARRGMYEVADSYEKMANDAEAARQHPKPLRSN